jgi:hypothetical protein
MTDENENNTILPESRTKGWETMLKEAYRRSLSPGLRVVHDRAEMINARQANILSLKNDRS